MKKVIVGFASIVLFASFSFGQGSGSASIKQDAPKAQGNKKDSTKNNNKKDTAKQAATPKQAATI
jgi:hypothetical protein